jgi:ribonuclease HI
MPYYAVHTGRTPGIYMTWDAAKNQIEGYTGAVYRSFKNILDAEQFLLHGKPSNPNVFKSPVTTQYTLPVKFSSPCAAASSPETQSPETQSPETPSPESRLTSLVSAYKKHKDFKAHSNTVHIYTDGSTLGNGKKGATGGYGVFIPGTIHVKEILFMREMVHGKITNGVAELKAMCRALEEILLIDLNVTSNIELEFIIHYDSTYAADVVTGKKQAKANAELVQKCKSLLAECSHLNLDFQHVYAHTGKQDLHSLGNEIADRLAARDVF